MAVKRTKEPAKVSTGKRIKYVRETLLNLTQQEFAAAFHGEFTRGALGNWERGEGVKLSNLRRISERFGVDMNWLTTGKGQPGAVQFPFEDKIHTEVQSSLDQTHTLDEFTSRELVQSSKKNYLSKIKGSLPEVVIHRGDSETGALRIMDDIGVKHDVSAEWLLSSEFVNQEARIKRNESIILSVTGDSMFPNYCTGDRVIVDLSQRDLLQDAVYAITDGRTVPVIKRLQRVFHSNPDRVRIISDNPHYVAEEHLLADVEIVGRVCGIIARR